MQQKLVIACGMSYAKEYNLLLKFKLIKNMKIKYSMFGRMLYVPEVYYFRVAAIMEKVYYYFLLRSLEFIFFNRSV